MVPGVVPGVDPVDPVDPADPASIGPLIPSAGIGPPAIE